MFPLSDDRAEVLAYVAELYHQRGWTQADIAKELGISRSSISRMLDEARELGIVETRIHYPAHRDQELETILQKRFTLTAVYILRSRTIPPERKLQRIASLAATHIEGRLRPDLILGLSWGTGVFETVQLLPRQTLPAVRVVQFIGAVGSGNLSIDGPEVARLAATILGAEYRYLNAPLVVSNEPTCQLLLAQHTVAETLALARQSHVALVGIGSTDPSVSSLLRAGYLTEDELRTIEVAGAVGDVCARHFDLQGQILDIDINHRIVGISVDDLRRVPEVIGVAGGVRKARAILGALRGQLIDTLVTDDDTAHEILRLAQAPSMQTRTRTFQGAEL